jgi:hypothetical protein
MYCYLRRLRIIGENVPNGNSPCRLETQEGSALKTVRFHADRQHRAAANHQESWRFLKNLLKFLRGFAALFRNDAGVIAVVMLAFATFGISQRKSQGSS